MVIKVEFIKEFLSPTTLTFLIIVIGYCIRNFKIFNLKLDLSMVLLLAVTAGYLIAMFLQEKDYDYLASLEEFSKMLSTLGTALFVCVVGVVSGYTLNFSNKRNWFAGLLGCCMALIGLVTALLIWKFDKTFSVSSLLGVVCGSLTTTPGLSTICELEKMVIEEAVLGYGSAYLFGVAFVVLFVQVINNEKEAYVEFKERKEKQECAYDGMIQMGLAIFLGSIIGSVQIFGFKFGNSGGILCCGIVIGYIVKKYFPSKKVAMIIIQKFREFGLSLFFVGAGIPAGIQLKMGFNVKLIVYGAIITMVTIFACFSFCKVFNKFKNVDTAGIISGCMTSTPAISVLLQKDQNRNLTQYFCAYVGSLITIVFLLRIFGQFILQAAI